MGDTVIRFFKVTDFIVIGENNFDIVKNLQWFINLKHNITYS